MDFIRKEIKLIKNSLKHPFVIISGILSVFISIGLIYSTISQIAPKQVEAAIGYFTNLNFVGIDSGVATDLTTHSTYFSQNQAINEPNVQLQGVNSRVTLWKMNDDALTDPRQSYSSQPSGERFDVNNPFHFDRNNVQQYGIEWVTSGLPTPLANFNSLSGVNTDDYKAIDVIDIDSSMKSGTSNAGYLDSDSFAIEFWYKPYAIGAQQTLFSDFGDHDGSNFGYVGGYQVELTSAGAIKFKISNAGGTVANVTGTNLSAGTWYHIMASYQKNFSTNGITRANRMDIYVNGALSGSATTSTKLEFGGAVPSAVYHYPSLGADRLPPYTPANGQFAQLVFYSNSIIDTLGNTPANYRFTHVTDDPGGSTQIWNGQLFSSVFDVGALSMADSFTINSLNLTGSSSATISVRGSTDNSTWGSWNSVTLNSPQSFITWNASLPAQPSGRYFQYKLDLANIDGTTGSGVQLESVRVNYIDYVNNPGLPGKVIDLTLTPADSTVTLDWQAPANLGTGITDYTIEYGLTSGWPENAATFSHAPSATTGAVITGLTNAANYTFRVTAVSGAGSGVSSNNFFATPFLSTSGYVSRIEVHVISTNINSAVNGDTLSIGISDGQGIGSNSVAPTSVDITNPTAFRYQFYASSSLPATNSLPSADVVMDTITSPTTVDLGDDSVSSDILLPFAVNMLGRANTHIAISSNGFVYLDSSVITNTDPGNLQVYEPVPFNNDLTRSDLAAEMSMGTTYLVAGAWADLYDDAPLGVPRISYGVIGTAPDRTFIVYFNGTNPCCDSSSGNTFQIKFFENPQASVVEPSSPSAGVTVSAVVDPVIVFSLTPSVCSLGSLSTSEVKTCSFGINVQTNAAGGYTASIKDANNGTLNSGANTITSQTTTLSAGTAGFGITSSSATGSITNNATCTNASTRVVTGITSSNQIIVDSSEPTLSESTTICVGAIITDITPAGSYSDVATVTVVGNF